MNLDLYLEKLTEFERISELEDCPEKLNEKDNCVIIFKLIDTEQKKGKVNWFDADYKRQEKPGRNRPNISCNRNGFSCYKNIKSLKRTFKKAYKINNGKLIAGNKVISLKIIPMRDCIITKFKKNGHANLFTYNNVDYNKLKTEMMSVKELYDG